MNTLKLIIILTCYGCFALGIDERPYCFKFTWPGAMSYNNTLKLNCTGNSYLGVPCVKPIIDGWFYPNTTKIYLDHKDDKDNEDSAMCYLQKGLTCIKYTNKYNNAILFASHYCGRVLEDKTTAISSGCFNYETDGHIIEVCACQSQPGEEPCNIATKQIASILMLFPSMIILFYYFHNV
ncbi:hypothetical protein M0804_005495 [Polistes exclamans]|nr:hypothetical protein M0804_005495 [Polistes exclamans]